MSARITVCDQNPKLGVPIKVLGRSAPFLVKQNAHDVARHWSGLIPDAWVAVYDAGKVIWLFRAGRSA